MIIISYPGIGKYETVRIGNGFIDLDIGCFKVDGEWVENWTVCYCRIAESLSKQGYVVFVPSYKWVRDYFRESDERSIIICPSKKMKDEWIQKLQVRFDNNKTTRNLRALLNAKDKFDKDIDEFINDGIPCVLIRHMNYNLLSVIYDLTIKNRDIDFHNRQTGWDEV